MQYLQCFITGLVILLVGMPNLCAQNNARKIALKATNGMYVCAENGGGDEVVVNRRSRSEWETFTMVDLGNNQVALIAHNGQHLCAEGGGGREVVANRNARRSWETFTLEDLGNRRITLKARNGQYLGISAGQGSALRADKRTRGLGATFLLEEVGPVSYSREAQYDVTLLRLDCTETQEGGEDEIYLQISQPESRRIPGEYRSMNEDSDISNWDINQTFRVDYSGRLSLSMYDYDTSSGDDHIGSFDLTITGRLEEASVRMTGGGSDYRLYYKVETITGASDFTMVFMSDSQYDYCVSEHCKDKLGDSYQANTKHVQSIQAIKDHSTNFRGVVINGDLTNTEDDHQRDQFIEDYQNNFTIYPGLGNHDYENYYTKWCAAPGVAIAKHYCTKEMLDYLESCVENINHTNFDHTFTHGDDGRKHVGSYSYSWDIGKYHFIQLNNYPSYDVEFDVYLSNWVAWEKYDINTSYNWLRRDLEQVAADKIVIINTHVMGNDSIHTDRFNPFDHAYAFGRFTDVLEPYVKGDQNEPALVAIFAGHLHSKVLDIDIDDNNKSFHNDIRIGTYNVPMFFCGSAEYSKFLQVDFKENQLEILVVDSTEGTRSYMSQRETITF